MHISETFKTEIEAGRVIKSTFLEGIGHFVYRRGTNSETILERHMSYYRTENGTDLWEMGYSLGSKLCMVDIGIFRSINISESRCHILFCDLQVYQTI